MRALCLYAFGVGFLLHFISVDGLSANERVPPFPDTMAVLGDSISEALLANQPLEDGISNRELMRLLGIARIRDPEKKKQAIRDAYADHGKVWSSGDDSESIVFSHLKRLRFVGRRDLSAVNFAVSGAFVSELDIQVDQLLSVQLERDQLFDYVTLMIGGNDLNQETIDEVPSAQSLVAGIEAQMRRLLDANPNVAILLVGLPNIHRIFEETHDLFVTRIFGKSYTCDDARRMIHGDSVLFERPGTEAYDQIKRILADLQWESEVLIERLQEDYPAAYLKTIQGYQGPEANYGELLSIDCFHPSEAGQAELAELTWIHGFWGDVVGRLLQLASTQ